MDDIYWKNRAIVAESKISLLDSSTYNSDRIIEWIEDGMKPASAAFTAGGERRVASLCEMAVANAIHVSHEKKDK